jgi:hypothetical protein
VFTTNLHTVHQYLPPCTSERNHRLRYQGRICKSYTIWIRYFQVCEVIDKDENKKEFLTRVLSGKYQAANERLDYKEIFIRIPDSKTHYHLGIVVLTYPDASDASSAYQKINSNKVPGYFSNTKILTQYKVLLKQMDVVIVCSETFITEPVKKFFDEIN